MAVFLSEYEVSWVSKFFNSFPHVDLTFQRVNSTFNPEDARYRESLVFWAAVPVLWLLVTLLVFLVYFCYRCCQRDIEKKKRVPCLRWSMAILAILTCAAVGVGLYGNEEARKGMDQFESSLSDADTTLGRIVQEKAYLTEDLTRRVDHGLNGIAKIFPSFSVNDTMQRKLDDLIQQTINSVQNILHEVSTILIKDDIGHNLDNFRTTSKVYGFYRWLSTLIYLCWMILLCLLLLFGIGRSSKCTLLIFCAFGIFTMVLCWMTAGIHTGISVGAGDFCVDPDNYIESLYKHAPKKEIINYYIKCNKGSLGGLATNPYLDALTTATVSLRKANLSFKEAQDLANILRIPSIDIHDYVHDVWNGLNATAGSLIHLTALVECTNLHKDYRDAVIGICSVEFPGVVFVLLSCMLCGLLFTVLVLMASRAWRHFSKRKGYLEVDEDDPFLPRAGDNSTSYYSFTRQGRPPGTNTLPSGGNSAGANRDHQMSLQRRPTPPPAYNSYDYRSPSEIHHHPHHMGGESPSHAPMAHHDEYPTFGRESHA